MSLLLFVLLVLVLLALSIYAVQLLTVLEPPLRQVISFVLVLIAIVLIAQRSGVFP